MSSSSGESQSSASIALFLPTLTPGGIETCILNLAKGFVQQNIAVDLVVADYRGDFISKVPDEANVVNLGVDRVLQSIIPLRQYLTSTEPDVLLAGHTHANIAAIIAGKTSRTETTIAVGIHNTHSVNTSKSQKFTSKAIQRLYPRLYSHADQVIAVSEGAKQDIVGHTTLGSNDVSVIYNPVVTEEVYIEASQPVDHRWLNDASLQVVLGAGRLVEQKDFATLLYAFEKVAKENNQGRLLIVGAGSKEQELRTLLSELDIEDRAELVGYVDNLYGYMDAADVFVLSSKWEGFGIVLVEAMAVRTPVVSTDCPHGPSEILKNGEYGKLVPVGDKEAMADGIRKSLRTERKQTRIQDRARDFSDSVITKEYANKLGLE